jgi:heptosyltransferase-2
MNKIYIRFPNWVGDVIMATSFLSLLRQKQPYAHITVAIRKHLSPLLWGNQDYNEILEISKREEHHPLEILKWAKRLKAENFNTAFILPPSFSSALPAFLSGIPARIGWKTDARGFLLNQGVVIDRHISRKTLLVRQYADLLQQTGIPKPESIHLPKLVITEKHQELFRQTAFYKKFILLNRPLIALNGSATYGPAKTWIPSRFAALAENLKSRTKGSVVLIGAPAEKQDLELIRGFADFFTFDECFIGSSQNGIAEMIALLSQIDLLISNDTGAAHISAALNRPTLVIFGSTSPLWTPPQGEKVKMIYNPSPCSPCFTKKCGLDRKRCMENISVNEVYEEAAKLLT